MQTESEELFEQLCTARGLIFRRIPVREVKTPDYELTLSCGPVLVEVKELLPNAADAVFEETLRTTGRAERWVDMGRVRLPIDDAVEQLRQYAKGVCPALVVLYDTMGMTNYLDPYSLAFSMYGSEKVHFAVPTDPRTEPSGLGMSRGGRSVATPKHNTTLSAVAVLDGTAQGVDPDLRVFHNCNAAIPLPLNALAEYGFRQFEFIASVPDTMPTWVERVPDAESGR